MGRSRTGGYVRSVTNTKPKPSAGRWTAHHTSISGRFDALTTASVIGDDPRIVEIVARKHYATSGCGARIHVRPAAPAVSPE